MAETTASPTSETESARNAAKGHFTKAIEEAKAGAQELGKGAQGRAGEYRERLNQTREELSSEARTRTEELRSMAYDCAKDGKAKASHAIASLSKMVEDNASVIDDKVGAQYGDYARTAARSMQDAAARLDEKSLEELAEDAKAFVREKPALAVGMAAATGYMLARLLRR